MKLIANISRRLRGFEFASKELIFFFFSFFFPQISRISKRLLSELVPPRSSTFRDYHVFSSNSSRARKRALSLIESVFTHKPLADSVWIASFVSLLVSASSPLGHSCEYVYDAIVNQSARDRLCRLRKPYDCCVGSATLFLRLYKTL